MVSADDDTALLTRPTSLFPMVRHISYHTTRYLLRTRLTPNQITFASLLTGCAAAWCFLQASYWLGVAGGLLLVSCYVLDNCDGEIARLTHRMTPFGAHFDTFVDWVIHGALFAALGIGVATVADDAVWAWLGWIACAGATINYAIGQLQDARENDDDEAPDALGSSPPPEGWKEKFIYAFRELSRADFCFIVLVLAVLDAAWLLLPAGAIGAQAYWILSLVEGARRFHV